MKEKQKRSSRLSGRNHPDPHRGYVEGSDPTGFDARNNAFWRTEKVGRQWVSEGLDRPTPSDGEKRTGSSGGLCRGAAVT